MVYWLVRWQNDGGDGASVSASWCDDATASIFYRLLVSLGTLAIEYISYSYIPYQFVSYTHIMSVPHNLQYICIRTFIFYSAYREHTLVSLTIFIMCFYFAVVCHECR